MPTDDIKSMSHDMKNPFCVGEDCETCENDCDNDVVDGWNVK